MVDFSKLKSKSATRTAELIEALKPQEKKSYDDARVWKPKMDSVKGVGGAVIRFLPNKDERVLDYVLFHEYSFKNEANNKYFIERSLRDISEKGAPREAIADLNARLWATGIKSNKDTASKQKQNARYTSNILVVNDPSNPDNNGKVMIYKFGPKIFGFVEALLKPKEDILTGEIPDSVNAFDLWEGANFEIRIKSTDNGWSYDDSKFSKQTPVAKSDALIEAIYNQTYSLNEFEALTNYKSIEALDKRLLDVLGSTVNGLTTIIGNPEDEFEQIRKDKPKTEEAPRQLGEDTKGIPNFDIDEPKGETSFATSDDESFFNNLMNEA